VSYPTKIIYTRLMGAGKPNPPAAPSDQKKKGLYGGLTGFVAAGASSSPAQEEFNPIKEGDKLNNELEKEFEDARTRNWSGRGRVGLGFSDDTGPGKIDTAPRSKKFDD